MRLRMRMSYWIPVFVIIGFVVAMFISITFGPRKISADPPIGEEPEQTEPSDAQQTLIG